MRHNDNISDEVKQRLISQALSQGAPKSVLPRPTGNLAEDLRLWRSHVSPVAEFIEEGDDDWNRLMAGIDMLAFSRWRRPSMMEIARRAFPVQSLPEGSLAFYDQGLTYSPPLEED